MSLARSIRASLPLIAVALPALAAAQTSEPIAQAPERPPLLEAPAPPTLSPLSEDAPTPEAGEGAVVEAERAEPVAPGVVASVEDMGDPPVEDENSEQTERNLSYDGGVGFHTIASADPGPTPRYRVGFFGSFFQADDAVRAGDENTLAAGRVIVQANPIEYASFHLGLGARSNENSVGRPEAMLSQGDLNLGALAYYPIAEGITVGADLNLFAPTTFGGPGADFGAISARPRLLASLDIGQLAETKWGPLFHLNLGYLLDRSESSLPDDIEDVTRVERFAYQVSAYDLVEIGLGAEYDLPYVRPYAGLWLGVPVNGRVECEGSELGCPGFGAAPMLLSYGVRAEPIDDLGVHAGMDLGITSDDAEGLPVTAPYTIALGLSYTLDPRPIVEYVETKEVIEREPARVAFAGRVVRRDNGAPIGRAIVEYVDQERSAQASAEADGRFTSYGFAPGTQVRLRASHPDYEPAEATGVAAKGAAPLTIELEPLPRMGQLSGRVLDGKDRPVGAAVVTLTGPGGATEIEVGPDGRFERELGAGAYTVAVNAPGYLTRGRDLSLEQGATLSIDVVLLPEPKEQLVKLRAEKIEIQEKVFFDTGKATIQQRSFNLLNQVGAVLLQNPQIRKVRIEGHTDDRGDQRMNEELSQARADAVRGYLVSQGIRPERLETKGYGPGRPILPNVSERNRALNRRVEFTIVDRADREVDARP